MKKEVYRKRYSVVTVVMLLAGGGVFIALGIGVAVALISSLVRGPRTSQDAYVIIPLLLFVVLPIALGTFTFVLGGRQVYSWVRINRAIKYGLETTAVIKDYKVVSHSKSGTMNKRYALTLSYKAGDGTKTFTTDYLFDINEFKHLRKLNKIQVKVDGNFVAVTEPFTEDVYKLDSRYEIETAFFKQKPVAKILRVWRIICLIAIAWLFISIVLTTLLKNGTYLLTGVIILLAVNLPVAIILAVYLIMWINGKRQ